MTWIHWKNRAAIEGGKHKQSSVNETISEIMQREQHFRNLK